MMKEVDQMGGIRNEHRRVDVNLTSRTNSRVGAVLTKANPFVLVLFYDLFVNLPIELPGIEGAEVSVPAVR